MKFALALLIAVHFWNARGVQIPCHPVAVAGADAQMPLDPAYPIQWDYRVPMAATTNCRVLMSSAAVALREDAPQWYCAAIVHEIGHLAGLPHSATGIMAPSLDAVEVPYDCVRWRTVRHRLYASPAA